jgi:hypothetical protein
MKMKYLVVLVLSLFALPSVAQDYSGIWSFGPESSMEFLNISQKGNQLMAERRDIENFNSTEYQGELEGLSGTLSAIFPASDCSKLFLEFSSDTLATAKLLSSSCSSSQGAAEGAHAFTFLIHKRN